MRPVIMDDLKLDTIDTKSVPDEAYRAAGLAEPDYVALEETVQESD